MIYASESLALSLVESLVHISGRLPLDYVAFRIRVPEEQVETLDAGRLPRHWHRDLTLTRAIGDQWMEQQRSVAIAVPSAVLPVGLNVLLNPAHRRFRSVEVVSEESFSFDARLR